jgi:hypothetical protein
MLGMISPLRTVLDSKLSMTKKKDIMEILPD